MSDDSLALKIPLSGPLSDADYAAMVAAIAETERGRWVLAEYARRNRNADTELVLSAIARVEAAIGRAGIASPTGDRTIDLAALAEAIAQSRAQLAEIAADMESEQTIPGEAGAPPALRQACATMVTEIIGAAEQVRDAAWGMRERDFAESVCEQLLLLAARIDASGAALARTDHWIGAASALLNDLDRAARNLPTPSAQPEAVPAEPTRVRADAEEPEHDGVASALAREAPTEAVPAAEPAPVPLATVEETLAELPAEAPAPIDEPVAGPVDAAAAPAIDEPIVEPFDAMPAAAVEEPAIEPVEAASASAAEEPAIEPAEPVAAAPVSVVEEPAAHETIGSMRPIGSNESNSTYGYHPEEARSAVSKDGSPARIRLGPSFETPAARAPQDEVAMIRTSETIVEPAPVAGLGLDTAADGDAPAPKRMTDISAGMSLLERLEAREKQRRELRAREARSDFMASAPPVEPDAAVRAGWGQVPAAPLPAAEIPQPPAAPDDVAADLLLDIELFATEPEPPADGSADQREPLRQQLDTVRAAMISLIEKVEEAESRRLQATEAWLSDEAQASGSGDQPVEQVRIDIPSR